MLLIYLLSFIPNAVLWHLATRKSIDYVTKQQENSSTKATMLEIFSTHHQIYTFGRFLRQFPFSVLQSFYVLCGKFFVETIRSMVKLMPFFHRSSFLLNWQRTGMQQTKNEQQKNINDYMVRKCLCAVEVYKWQRINIHFAPGYLWTARIFSYSSFTSFHLKRALYTKTI